MPFPAKATVAKLPLFFKEGAGVVISNRFNHPRPHSLKKEGEFLVRILVSGYSSKVPEEKDSNALAALSPLDFCCSRS
jgi:hypothetical protein